MSLRLPKCDYCNHNYYDEEKKKECCAAYPDGIPLDAMNWDKESECANGIKYEPETKHPS